MLAEGHPGDGPVITPVDSVSSLTLLGLCVSSVALICGFAMTWWYCRRRREHTKLGSDKSLAFRPPRRKPTAVKSPGSTSHYLKKSPSPTGPGKSPPGSGGGTSPTSNNGTVGIGASINTSSPFPASLPAATETNEVLQSPNGQIAPSRLSIENERDKAELENSEKAEGGVENRSSHSGFLGQLVFKLRYILEQNALVVSVVRCKGLPARGQHNATSDPYVKLQLLPDKQHRTKTRVLRNTRDPVYDEDFTFFGISQNQLQKISLHFIVMSFDRYSRDDVIGEVVCALSAVADLQLANNQQIMLCQEICPRSLKIQSQGRGELLVSLCWQPETSKLTVVVLKARNLPKMDVSGLADPYVKIYLLYNQQRIAKRKTHVKKRTLNPIFNESIVFEIPSGTAEGLGKISLEFAMLDWDRVTKNEIIGRLEIGGPKCTGSAMNHWNEVCNSPKRQIADWHKLRE